MVRNRLSPFMILLIIIIFGILLRCIFFSGYQVGDDKHYLVQAYKFSTGDFTPGGDEGNLWRLRIGLIGPTALFFFLFGVNEFSAVLFSFLCSIGGIILIYHFGRLLFDKNTGLIASFLLSFLPLDVIYATHLYPDIPLAFFVSLSIFLFLKGDFNDNKLYHFLSGVFIGVAYLNRVNSLLIILFFVFYILLYKKRIKINYFFVVLGFLLIFSLETLLYYIQTGELFYRHSVISAHGVADTWRPRRGDIWILEPLLTLLTHPTLGFFPYFILPIVIYSFFRRNKSIVIILLWLIPISLYVFYGSVRLSKYQVLIRDPRYLSIVITPAILILAYYLIKIVKHKLLYSLSISFLLLTSIISISTDNSRITDYLPQKIYNFYKNHPDRDLIVRAFDYFSLLFYSKFEKDTHLKLFCIDDFNSDTVNNIRDVYPDVDIIIDLNKVHNTYVIIDTKYANYIPLNSKLVETIRKPKRFYYSILENGGFFKEVFKKIRGKRGYKFEQIYQIYYIK